MADLKSPVEESKATEANIIARPSNVMKHFTSCIEVDSTCMRLTLVTMKKTFLLVIENLNALPLSNQTGDHSEPDSIPMEVFVRGFTDSNQSLRGLCLAIGDHSTCLIDSDNSLESATLASKLSKKLNAGYPVYVANNLDTPSDGISMAKIQLKIFKFVEANYVH